MPDVNLTREICNKLHEAPKDVKERAEDVKHSIHQGKHDLKNVEKERSGYQQPGLWNSWRVE
ncbi:hypothetical protein MIB92_12885 [Aestuariirhabdus sp. Z084]|uniref:hypothetical protein n=1 Tax=Aestuariirhabdus haliotis TaxID=2918751 RepID=UPI00201B409F|nr:hypothetical protein [Aestuariirhabdus haliotis]MCL6416548.1 hypothetical protein [Aestuariirhabdus haliotis]MCL6420538.1 hypothetical protein [Aestuariirhabdus haliotis]